MGFLDNLSYESKENRLMDKLMVIKLFSCNYARDLVFKKGLLPAHGFRTVSAIVLIGFTLSDMVYYNCKN
jgi:hypothetical protein